MGIMKTVSRKVRRAFSLMELLVVLSILALLAAIAIPKIIDAIERGRSATQAYSSADVARQVEIYFGLNHKYPDGWDTLTEDGGSLYTKLAPELKSPNTILTTATLTADQITSLNNAGIHHAFLHDTASTDYSSSGTDRRHFSNSASHDGTANITTTAAIDKTTGSEGLEMLKNDFGLNPNMPASDTTLPIISANTYVVFGLGPKSKLVQSSILEAPIMEHTNSASSYSRAMVVFQVPNTGTAKAKMVGVMGPDGRTKRTASQDFNNPNGAQPH
jgi:prepilin-type N-terminal cleavage/methylation domain-containing protein